MQDTVTSTGASGVRLHTQGEREGERGRGESYREFERDSKREAERSRLRETVRQRGRERVMLIAPVCPLSSY